MKFRFYQLMYVASLVLTVLALLAPVAGFVDADALHVLRREQFGATTVNRHFVDLFEAASGELAVLCRGHNIRCVKDLLSVEECFGVLRSRVCCQTLGYSTLFGDNVEVEAALSVR